MKTFEIDFRKGTLIDSVSRTAGTLTGSSFIKAEKGYAVKIGLNEYITYPTQLLPEGAFSIVIWAKLKNTHILNTDTVSAIAKDLTGFGVTILSGAGYYANSVSLRFSDTNNKKFNYIPNKGQHCYIFTIPGAGKTDINLATLTVDGVEITPIGAISTGLQDRSGIVDIGGGIS